MIQWVWLSRRATLAEIETHWTVHDLADALAALDAEARVRREQEAALHRHSSGGKPWA